MNLRNLAILTAFVLCSLSLDARAQDEVWETTVGLDAVREEPVSETAAVIGRFVSRQSGVVAAQSRGAVAEVRRSTLAVLVRAAFRCGDFPEHRFAVHNIAAGG